MYKYGNLRLGYSKGGKIMNNKMYLKKAALCVITIFCLAICDLENISAAENADFDNKMAQTADDIMENYIPEEVTHYFNQIYDSAIAVGNDCGLIDEKIPKTNLKVGKPFKIFELNGEDKAIWYYPIYSGTEIIVLITIGLIDNSLNYSLTQEFVEQLNQISYNGDILFFKDNDVIYSTDKENNIYSISYGELRKTDINKNYSELIKHIVLNYPLSSMPVNAIRTEEKIPNALSLKGGTVVDIDEGKECLMTDCFVKQYEHGICWAASVATILRYLNTEYLYSSLNAFDVAYTLAYYEDIPTDNPNDDNSIWRCGATGDDVQFLLAVYGVYYSTINKKLSFSETKNAIDKGYPVYMRSKAYYDSNNDGIAEWNGHATVIYGYYSRERNQYYKMWNPGNGTSQIVRHNISGNAVYFYNNQNFEWYSTVCNGIRNMK